MSIKAPKTPFSTRLSGNAKETELRLRSIAQWQKKRPPFWALAVTMLIALSCGGLVSCQSAAVSKDTDIPLESEETILPDALLLADGEEITIGDTVYHAYFDNRGVLRLREGLGNGYLMRTSDCVLLSTLDNGAYPINSHGETYGYEQLADFVGEPPALIAVVGGLDDRGNDINGYVRWEDHYADFSDPAVSAKYEPSPANIPHDARAAEDARWWRIPLYDAEHNQIGTYDVYEGKYQETGYLIRSLESEAYMAQRTQQSEASTSKVTLSNHGNHLGTASYASLTQEEKDLLAQWPNGTYPTNSKGEYYGPDGLKYYLQIEPDLVSATGTNGEAGYYWWEDAQRRFSTPEELHEVVWSENGYLIPLYDSEHDQIGWTEIRVSVGSADTPSVFLNIHTVGAIWEQIG